jgi:formate-dependent nitrite reductase membrane component NrfD
MNRDGSRHIDSSLAHLQGEGAQQLAEGGGPSSPPVWAERPSKGHRLGTYYERPVLKEPVWIWAVPAYFYAGGAAGAVAVLAEVADAFGDDTVAGLVARARQTAAAAAAVGTALLVHDLGRPERFLNMLRVVRPSSPMSLGSWVLAGATPAFAAAALLAGADSPLRRVGALAGKAGLLLALPLTSYTGVLLSATAVPLWQQTRRTLPLLFAASATSSGAALLQLFHMNEIERRTVSRFALLGEIAELAAGAMFERDAERVPRVARPLHDGVSSSLWKAAKVLTCSSLALNLVPKASQPRRIVAGLLASAGAMCIRAAVFEAGKASARDPRATFVHQRSGRS